MCTDLLIIAQTMICYTFNDYEPPSETEVRQLKILLACAVARPLVFLSSPVVCCLVCLFYAVGRTMTL
jgi:hypothetical protein